MTAKSLIIRTPSGISGDMIVTGFAKLLDHDSRKLNDLVAKLNIPALKNALEIREVAVQGISGFQLSLQLPREHAHRSLTDITRIIEGSQLTSHAKELASATFKILSEAESAVHSIPPDKVTFHEIGALDSILDICLASALFDILSPEKLIVSPLPVCDGHIETAHGLMPTPAPAVIYLLKGIPIYGVDSEGETVTPTALALLKALGAEFSKWPEITLEKTVRIYGSKILPNIPNGAIFSLGVAHDLNA